MTNELTKEEKRRKYYIEYYKKNRDRLLEYQHHYNQTHNIIKSPVVKTGRRYGKLATTRNNIQKRLEAQEMRVKLFKEKLALEKGN